MRLARVTACSEVRGQAEPHPRASVVVGIPRASAHLGKHVVVGGGVAPQVLLDTRKDRCDDCVACQNQRLQRATHPTVAVAERVDHHEVEVSHRRPNEDGRVISIKPLEHVRIRGGTASLTGPS